MTLAILALTDLLPRLVSFAYVARAAHASGKMSKAAFETSVIHKLNYLKQTIAVLEFELQDFDVDEVMQRCEPRVAEKLAAP
eukprot:2687145-Rhodomonas_salina.1